MANNTTKKAGSNKSFIDRMGGQKEIWYCCTEISC